MTCDQVLFGSQYSLVSWRAKHSSLRDASVTSDLLTVVKKFQLRLLKIIRGQGVGGVFTSVALKEILNTI